MEERPNTPFFSVREGLALLKEAYCRDQEGKYQKLELMSLPNEILDYIGKFLEPRDLIALTGTCSRLREVYNVDSAWTKYTGGGVVGRKLKCITSVVHPQFVIPDTLSLQPLCEQRRNFARQSRLINNLKKENVIQCDSSIAVDLRDQYESLFSLRKMTYKTKYLFARSSDHKDVLVIDIEYEPRVFTVLTPGGQIKWVQVVDSLLVLCLSEDTETVIEFREIKLPEIDFPLLYFIPHGSYYDVKVFISGSLLIKNNFKFENNISIWDIASGSEFHEIAPKIVGSKLNVFACSEDLKSLLILSYKESFELLVYNLNLDKYTFSAPIPVTDFSYFDGVLSDRYAVLFAVFINECTIFVFDIKTSTMINKLEVSFPRFKCSMGSARIINNSLIFAETSSVMVLNLRDLKFEWRIGTHNVWGFWGVDYLDLPHFRHFLGVWTHEGFVYELWDFEARTMLFKFGKCSFTGFSDSFSQLITAEYSRLSVLKLW